VLSAPVGLDGYAFSAPHHDRLPTISGGVHMIKVPLDIGELFPAGWYSSDA
jgi:hypothetical protein